MEFAITPSDTGGIAVTFDGGESTLALKPRPAPSIVDILFNGPKRAGGYFPNGECIEMIPYPAGFTGFGGKGME